MGRALLASLTSKYAARTARASKWFLDDGSWVETSPPMDGLSPQPSNAKRIATADAVMRFVRTTPRVDRGGPA